MKLPPNSAATLVKMAIAFAIFAVGYYFPLFRPASSSVAPPGTPSASAATSAPSAGR